MENKLKIIVIVLFIVIIAGAAFGAYEMEIGPFEEDDDNDNDNGGNEPADDGKPVAVIGANRTHGDPDELFHFNGSSSYDGETNITTYTWNFGDGNTEENVSAEHSWVEPGAYNVSLTVTDSDGNFNKSWMWVGVTYRENQDGTINSGQDGFSFDMSEMASMIYINQTVANNVEDIDDNDITLNVHITEGIVWTQNIQSGWQDPQDAQYTNDTNLSATTYSWEIVINDSGFVGSIDWDVEVVVIYI